MFAGADHASVKTQREEQSGQDAGHQNAFGPQIGSEKGAFEVEPVHHAIDCGDARTTAARPGATCD